MSAAETADPRDARIRELEAEVEGLRARLPLDIDAVAKEARKRFLRFIVERVNPGFEQRHYGDVSSWTREVWQEAGQLGLIGFNAVKELGGEGRDAGSWNIICEELAKLIEDPGFLVITLIQKNWANLIHAMGREDLCERYARPIVRGDLTLAWAITEAAEPGSLKSSAKKKDGGWVLNAHKPLVTAGMWAGVFAVACRDEESNDTLMFLVQPDDPNVEVVQVATVGGQHGGFTNLTLRDTWVPEDRLLLDADAVGRVSALFNHGVLNTMAVHLGWLERMFQVGITSLRQKVRAGQRMLDIPHVQTELGRLHLGIEQAKAVFHKVVQLYAKNEEDPISEPLTLVFKHVVTEWTINNARTMLMLHGATGYLDENPWGRYLTHTAGLVQVGMSQDLVPQTLASRMLVEMEMKRLRRVGL